MLPALKHEREIESPTSKVVTNLLYILKGSWEINTLRKHRNFTLKAISLPTLFRITPPSSNVTHLSPVYKYYPNNKTRPILNNIAYIWQYSCHCSPDVGTRVPLKIQTHQWQYTERNTAFIKLNSESWASFMRYINNKGKEVPERDSNSAEVLIFRVEHGGKQMKRPTSEKILFLVSRRLLRIWISVIFYKVFPVDS